jgi:UDP-N-acetylglucosamine--dolichyl-phosphate N-acetylglucosaminephosphotransferase
MMNEMTVDYGLLLTFIVAIMMSARLMHWFIWKMRVKNVMVKDMHKPDGRSVATNAGILTLFVVLITVIFLPLVFRFVNRLAGPDFLPRDPSDLDNAILIVLLMYAFYGVLDDFIDVGRTSKIILPLLFSYPLVLVLSGWDPWIPGVGVINSAQYRFDFWDFGEVTGSTFIRYIIVPVYIMVVANLKNMHSGFNGLQSGCAFIVLITVLMKAWYENDLNNLYTAAAITGALLVFLWYNKYPSLAFEGNIGSMAVGGALGAIIVSKHYLWAGVVMLIPHIANFLLYAYWRLQNKRHPEDVRFAAAKFAKVREDGTLEVPNPYTLKWVLPYHYRMNEKQATMAMWAVTAVFCALGFWIPG